MQGTGKSYIRPSACKRLFLVPEKLLTIAAKTGNVAAVAAGADPVHSNLGMLGMDDGNTANAKVWFSKQWNSNVVSDLHF